MIYGCENCGWTGIEEDLRMGIECPGCRSPHTVPLKLEEAEHIVR